MKWLDGGATDPGSDRPDSLGEVDSRLFNKLSAAPRIKVNGQRGHTIGHLYYKSSRQKLDKRDSRTERVRFGFKTHTHKKAPHIRKGRRLAEGDVSRAVEVFAGGARAV